MDVHLTLLIGGLNTVNPSNRIENLFISNGPTEILGDYLEIIFFLLITSILPGNAYLDFL